MTYRNVRIIMGDRITVLSARQGAHLVVGDRSEPARTLELGERDRPVWCTVTVHAPESESVGAELTRGPGRPPGPGGRRTVDIRFRLTEAEAGRLGLAGEDRHERARERVTDSARAEALTAALERAQQALRAILDATGCSYSPPPDEWPRAAVEEVRRVVAGFGGAP